VTRVLMLRHAESQWNALGRWQGRADPDLSTEGETQAGSAAAGLSGADRIVSSNLRRAARSAAIIAEKLNLGPVVIDADLGERDVGAWAGLTNEEVDERWPGYRASGRVPDGWEPNDRVLQRALAAIERAAAGAGHTVVAVTHAGLIRTVEAHLGQPRRPVPNLAGRWIDVHGGRLTAGPRVCLLPTG
jgi:broad specificity phosphatase PhoE